MEKDLKEKLLPVLDEYIGGLLKEYDKVNQLQKQTEIELIKIREQQKRLKEQVKEHNILNKEALDKLGEEKEKQIKLNNNMRDEVSRCNKVCSENEMLQTEIKENLKDAQLKNENITTYIDKAKAKENEYQTLIELLRKDQQKNEEERQRVAQLERNAKTQARVNAKVQEEIAFKEMEQVEKELKMQAREAEVKRLKKKYQLSKLKESNVN